MHGLAQTPVPARSDTHGSRWALRLELSRVTHWRRLVRARINLAVAAVILPDALGQDPTGVLPTGIERDLPDDLELAVAVLSGLPDGELDRIGDLRALDARLASYEATIGQALDGATAEYVRRLAAHPSACATALTGNW